MRAMTRRGSDVGHAMGGHTIAAVDQIDAGAASVLGGAGTASTYVR